MKFNESKCKRTTFYVANTISDDNVMENALLAWLSVEVVSAGWRSSQGMMQ